MSESASRFVSLLTPDVIEAGARSYLSGAHADENANPFPKTRQPRQPGIPRPFHPGSPGPAALFGKQEIPMDANNPKPDEIQAGLDATLAKFVDEQPTALKRSETLIKIGQYQVELNKYAPLLRDADAETAGDTLADWFADGDAPLKKAMVNVHAGTEAFPLIKTEVAEGPDVALARMLDALPEGAPRAALLQKMAVYMGQVQELTSRGEMLKVDPAVIEAAVADWVENSGDDGSHRLLKRSLADADRLTRAQAEGRITEKDVVHQWAGNASSHAGTRMTGSGDRAFNPRSTQAGAGNRMRGSDPAPDQASAPVVNPGSGLPGAQNVNPLVIRRKGTTGGLGSVSGVENGDGAHHDPVTGVVDIDPKTGKKRVKTVMDKNADLAVELIKIAPRPMIEALDAMSSEQQVAVCQEAAQEAADLMAWSAQQGETLAKSAMDAAVVEWLSAEPETVQVKRWVAEALGSAGEIPLPLAKAIMGWNAAPAAQFRLRQPARQVA